MFLDAKVWWLKPVYGLPKGLNTSLLTDRWPIFNKNKVESFD